MINEDLTVFLKDFGVEAVFSRNQAEVLRATVIFDTPPVESSLYDRSFYDEKFYAAKVVGANPVIYGRVLDLQTIQSNDVCLISGVNYYVRTIEPDGTGFLLISLSLNKD